MLFLCNIANVTRLKNNRNRSKIELTQIIINNYMDKNVEARVRASPETSTCEVPRDISRKLQLTLCAIMASSR